MTTDINDTYNGLICVIHGLGGGAMTHIPARLCVTQDAGRDHHDTFNGLICVSDGALSLWFALCVRGLFYVLCCDGL